MDFDEVAANYDIHQTIKCGCGKEIIWAPVDEARTKYEISPCKCGRKPELPDDYFIMGIRDGILLAHPRKS
jgi:hypothetical protein